MYSGPIFFVALVKIPHQGGDTEHDILAYCAVWGLNEDQTALNINPGSNYSTHIREIH